MLGLSVKATMQAVYMDRDPVQASNIVSLLIALSVFANETILVCCRSLRWQQHPCGSAIEPTLKHNTNQKVDMHYSICNSRASHTYLW